MPNVDVEGERLRQVPRALAHKFAAEEKTTVLSDVLWDVGKIAPTVALESVFVRGPRLVTRSFSPRGCPSR
jgi:NAD-dependent DNA ligase